MSKYQRIKTFAGFPEYGHNSTDVTVTVTKRVHTYEHFNVPGNILSL